MGIQTYMQSNIHIHPHFGIKNPRKDIVRGYIFGCFDTKPSKKFHKKTKKTNKHKQRQTRHKKTSPKPTKSFKKRGQLEYKKICSGGISCSNVARAGVLALCATK